MDKKKAERIQKYYDWGRKIVLFIIILIVGMALCKAQTVSMPFSIDAHRNPSAQYFASRSFKIR